jgi:hypothetical protein
VLAVTALLRKGVSASLVFPLTVAVLAYPHYLLTFHGSGTELTRHNIVVGVTLRVALLIVVFVAIDRLAVQGRSGRPSATADAGATV